MPTQTQTGVDVGKPSAAAAADARTMPPVCNTSVPVPGPSIFTAAPHLAMAGYNPIFEAAFGAILNRKPPVASTGNASSATTPTICNTMPSPALGMGLTAFATAPLIHVGNYNPIAEAAIGAIFNNKRQQDTAPSLTKPTKKRRTKTKPTGPGVGPWTDAEELAFRRGCILHGIGSWAAISKVIPTGRSPDQVKSHAQKIKDNHPELWEELVKRSKEGGNVSSLKCLGDFVSKRRFPYGKAAKAAKKKVGEAGKKLTKMEKDEDLQEQQEVESMEDTQSPMKLQEPKRPKAESESHTKPKQRLQEKKPKAERKQYTRKSPPVANMWTDEEHSAFQLGCKLHGIPNWSRIAEEIPSRNAVQVKSHAQKIKIHRPAEWEMLIKSNVREEEKVAVEKEGKKRRSDEGIAEMEEKKSAIADEQLESAGTLLLLASGDGGRSKADTSIKEAPSTTSSSTSGSELEQPHHVCTPETNDVIDTRNCSRKLENSNNETPRCRRIMGYNAMISFRNKQLEPDSGQTGEAMSLQQSITVCEETHSRTLSKVSDSTDGDTDGSLLPHESLAAEELVVLSKETPHTGNRTTSAEPRVNTTLVGKRSTSTSDTFNDHNLSVSTLRTILSGLNPSELAQVLPSKDKEINSLRSENESLKAIIEKLQLKLAMEKRRKVFKRPAMKVTCKDASVRAGLSALKARGRKAPM